MTQHVGEAARQETCTCNSDMPGTAIMSGQEGEGHLVGRVLPFECIVPLLG